MARTHDSAVGARGRASRLLAVVVTVAALGAACTPKASSPPPPIPTSSCIGSAPRTAAEYQQLFDVRATEAAAGDTWSPTTSGTRTVWFLGDTFVGKQSSPGVLAPGYRSVHNALEVQSANCLETKMKGIQGSRTDWFPQPNATDYYWPAGTYVDASGIKLVLLLVRPFDRPGEAFDFYVAGVRIAALGTDLNATSIVRPAPLTDTSSESQANIPYGNWVAQDSQYVYLYGSVHTSTYSASNYVARATPANVVNGPWEYWAGAGWSPDPTQVTAMPFVGNAPLSQLRVTRYGNGWLGIAKMIDGYTEDVTAWYSLSPTGPWQRVPTPNGDGRIATTPKSDDIDLMYGATLANLPGAGWTVMWNVNALPASDVAANILRYGPKFLAPSDLPPPQALFGP